MVDNWVRVYNAAGVTKEDSVFFAFSFGPFLGFWTAFEAATKLGALAIPTGGLSSVARLERLLSLSATVLCCTPSYALRLGLTARDQRIDLRRARVSTIIVAGECGGSDSSTRCQIEELWNGARVFDHYGMTEVGPAGYSCPAVRDVMHIFDDSYIAEVIDPKAALPINPGEMGELVLTPLGRVAAPVLRSRTGDLVKPLAASSCECGSRDLALDHGILGRVDDMLTVRGVNIFPSAVEQILLVHGIVNYRVDVFEKRGMPELRLAVEGNEDQLRFALENDFQVRLGLRVELAFVERDALPYSDGKNKKWIRHTR